MTVREYLMFVAKIKEHQERPQGPRDRGHETDVGPDVADKQCGRLSKGYSSASASRRR